MILNLLLIKQVHICLFQPLLGPRRRPVRLQFMGMTGAFEDMPAAFGRLQQCVGAFHTNIVLSGIPELFVSLGGKGKAGSFMNRAG